MTKRIAKHKPQTRVLFAISFLVFLVAAASASSKQIFGLELKIFRFINNWPDSLRPIFITITQFGSAWMLFAVTLICLKIKRYRLAVRIFASGAIAFLLTEFIKRFIARPRPGILLTDLNLRESLFLGYGFPSGHTAVATVVGLLLLPVIPKSWRPVCLILILLVGLSRIYLGVHAPLDVIGGFAVGFMVVCLSHIVRNKLGFVTKITHLKLTD